MTRPANVAMAPAGPRLPRPPALIGRETMLAELETSIGQERLVTLTGPGGSGKTALAVALLHRVVPRFPEGGAFVDLGAVTRPDEVLTATATALRISPRGTQSLGDRLASYLADRCMVLVLDNVEHVLESVPELAPLVDASCGAVIATSRTPLGLVAERVTAVPPLDVPSLDGDADVAESPSVRLFLQAARAAGGDVGEDGEYLDDVARICRAVDGLPLALEIVAAQTRVESVAEVADELLARLPRMTRAVADAPARQQTLEAAIGWSLARLGPGARRAFRDLAVFEGAFDVDGAAAVLATHRRGAIDRLAELVGASLLVRVRAVAGRARFRMLQPVRAVARGPGNPVPPKVVARHASFVVAEIDRLCPTDTGIRSPVDLEQLREAQPDLIAALDHLAVADPDRCVSLVVQLEDFWRWTGGELEAMAAAESALDSGLTSAAATCDALVIRALGQSFVGDVDGSIASIDRAHAVVDASVPPITRARLWWRDAVISIEIVGDAQRGASALHAMHLCARLSGDVRLQALARAHAVLLTLDQGPEPRPGMHRLLEAALETVRERSMSFAEARILQALGFLQERRSEVDEAWAWFRRGLGQANRFASPFMAGVHANNLGDLALRNGETEAARSLLLWALRAWDRGDQGVAVLTPLAGLAQVERHLQRWANAVTLFSAYEALADRMHAPGLLVGLETDREELQRAATHLGAADLAAATARGREMTLREALDFAYQVNGVAPNRRSRVRPLETEKAAGAGDAEIATTI